jgi:xylulokinase
MAVILGIDLGTSSVKALLLDTGYGEAGAAARAHDVTIAGPLGAEQDPEEWWRLTVEILRELRTKYPKAFAEIAAIGFSGQMHGLVTVDSRGRTPRPAMVWLDQRSRSQTQAINALVRDHNWIENIQNRIAVGFALPSLRWLKESEPEVFSKIQCWMLPKDYLRLKMTGSAATDFSDASATGAFAIDSKKWAWPLIDALDLPRGIFLPCSGSSAAAGCVSGQCAGETGLKAGIPVVFGAGDQMAQSIGNGAVREGPVIANIGTGGQVAACSGKDVFDPKLRTHTFCHAIDGAYTVFGATLCGGMSLKWLKNNILKIDNYQELDAAAGSVEAGSGGVVFLPYLSGERTPHMDPDAKGMFFGLRLGHDHRFMARAVMEGVTFSLKNSLDILTGLGVSCKRIIASGGGAQSALWLQMQADIFEKEIQVLRVKEQACLGACILAGLGTGLFKDVQSACDQFTRFDPVIFTPDAKTSGVYRGRYDVFQELYQRTSDLMAAV